MRKVEALPSGRYKVRFRHGASERTGKPKQASETFSSKAEADQFAKWLDALGPQGALDKLYEGEQQAAASLVSALSVPPQNSLSWAGAHRARDRTERGY